MAHFPARKRRPPKLQLLPSVANALWRRLARVEEPLLVWEVTEITGTMVTKGVTPLVCAVVATSSSPSNYLAGLFREGSRLSSEVCRSVVHGGLNFESKGGSVDAWTGDQIRGPIGCLHFCT